MAEGSEGLVSGGSGAFGFQETCVRLSRLYLISILPKRVLTFEIEKCFFFGLIKKMVFIAGK